MSIVINLSKKYGKQFLDTATKSRLDALKTAYKKVMHKAVEATGDFIRNKIADKIVKPKPITDANSRNVEEIVVQPEKRKILSNKLKQVL